MKHSTHQAEPRGSSCSLGTEKASPVGRNSAVVMVDRSFLHQRHSLSARLWQSTSFLCTEAAAAANDGVAFVADASGVSIQLPTSCVWLVRSHAF